MKHYFSFKGRIGRLEYFLSCLVSNALCIPVNWLLEDESLPAVSVFLVIIFGVVPIFWFFIAQGVKRCHDVGHSGWFFLIPLYYLWIIFYPGSVESNEYGDPVK